MARCQEVAGLGAPLFPGVGIIYGASPEGPVRGAVGLVLLRSTCCTGSWKRSCGRHVGRGFGVAVYRPLAGGAPTGKYGRSQVPSGTRAALNPALARWVRTERNLRLIDELTGLAEETGLSLTQFALAWV